MTGFVDRVAPRHGPRMHSISVSGRSKTQDLVDCSITGPRFFRDRTILQISQKLAGEYGITVELQEVRLGKIAVFQAQAGETPYEAIERLARSQGLLVTDNQFGELVLTEAASLKSTDALVVGKNVISGGGSYDASDRYSQIIVRGQVFGDDSNYGRSLFGANQDELDSEVARRRALIVDLESIGNRGSIQDRARWEIATRAGKSATFSYTVRGWRQSDGSLWTPNQLVDVDDSLIGLDTELLIVERTFSLDEQGGQITTMQLGPPDGYRLLPPADEKRTGKLPFWQRDAFLDAVPSLNRIY